MFVCCVMYCGCSAYLATITRRHRVFQISVAHSWIANTTLSDMQQHDAERLTDCSPRRFALLYSVEDIAYRSADIPQMQMQKRYVMCVMCFAVRC